VKLSKYVTAAQVGSRLQLITMQWWITILSG